MKDVYIYPAKKGRRVLVFLADFFICLISSIFLFEIVVFQIAKPIVSYNDILNNVNNLEKEQWQILEENDLISIVDSESSRNEDLQNTAIKYIEYYVFEDENNIKNDVIYNYFVTIKGNDVSYVNNLMKENIEGYLNLNSYTSLGTYKLNDTFKEMYAPYFTEGDELSENGQTSFDDFKESKFLSLFNYVITDINTNDLNSIRNPTSFLSLKKEIDDLESSVLNTYIVCSVISYFISSVVLFLIVPIFSSKKQTLAERIMKVERVEVKNINYLNKKKSLIVSLINIFENLSSLMFIPVITLGVSSYSWVGIFSLTPLVAISLVGLVFVIVQLIVVLASKYAKSFKEIATNTLLCDTATIDDFYREMNYE